ncbi:MAG TPA: RDD family protein [Pseudolysinimonas sp.]|nr:RDD family protein [Pseudolysinimonas sp.]
MDEWPGQRLGLPESGPRSIARFGPRVAAIFIDWAIAWVISAAFFADGPFQPNAWATLAVFAVEQLVFLWTLNGSIGHLLLRMRVVPVRPARLGLWRPMVRTALLCLAIPALIWDRDQRGLHDQLAGTMLVRV